LNIYNTKDPNLQPYKEMVENLFIYFNDYEIDNILRDNNRYVDAMASTNSIAPTPIEDEETIITIKKIDKPYHDFIFEYFIEDHYFSAKCINACEWYQDVFNYLKYGVILINFIHKLELDLKS